MSTLSPRARKALAAASLALGAPILAGPITATAADPVVNQAPVIQLPDGASTPYMNFASHWTEHAECACGYFQAGTAQNSTRGPFLQTMAGLATPTWLNGYWREDERVPATMPVIQVPEVYVTDAADIAAAPFDPRAWAPDQWTGLNTRTVVACSLSSGMAGLTAAPSLPSTDSGPDTYTWAPLEFHALTTRDHGSTITVTPLPAYPEPVIPTDQDAVTLTRLGDASIPFDITNLQTQDCLPGGKGYVEQLRGCKAAIIQHIVVVRRSVATDDAARTAYNTSTTIAIASNDKSIAIAGATTGGLSTPNHGTAVLNADGTVRYTPTNGFTGTDSFTYTITDSVTKKTSTATVTVTVEAPTNPTPSVTPSPEPTTPAPPPAATTPAVTPAPQPALSNTGSPISAPWLLAAAASTSLGAWLLSRRARHNS